VKTTELELDMATVEERRYEEHEEFDMFHTDRDIVKRQINFQLEENKGDAEVPRPMLRDGCNLEEFKSFTQQWRLYAGCHNEMIGSSDNSCCAAQTDPCRPPCTMPSAARSMTSPRLT
jgi:hypothetical protein